MEFKLNWLFRITSMPFEKVELPLVFGNDPLFVVKVKTRKKKKIKLIAVKEFGGIDHLPDKLEELLEH